MATAACTEDEFIALWEKHGSPTKVARELGICVRKVHARRDRIEARRGISLRSRFAPGGVPVTVKNHAGRINMDIDDGTVIVFGDAHFWPDIKTTANRALLAMIRQMKPVAVVNNGDSFDGAVISRFPRPFYDEGKPSVVKELRVCEERLNEIKDAAGKAECIWPLGNHDNRFEAKLAAQAPEYQGIKGFHLRDWFPDWRPCWSFWINDEVEIRHRYRNGIHATHNNVMANHHTTVTGHLHALQVRPYVDGRGQIKYGVDTGTLADPDGPQFMDYMEGRIPNWRSGFILLTFKDGELLMPEMIMKHDEDTVQFRGHLLHADTLEIV